jgi:hypothetical protein
MRSAIRNSAMWSPKKSTNASSANIRIRKTPWRSRERT